MRVDPDLNLVGAPLPRRTVVRQHRRHQIRTRQAPANQQLKIAARWLSITQAGTTRLVTADSACKIHLNINPIGGIFYCAMLIIMVVNV